MQEHNLWSGVNWLKICRWFYTPNLPRFFVTNQNRSLSFNKDGTPTARTNKILSATPMKKFGEISDLLGTLMWLADDNASGFVTGTIIPVDGGFSAYSGVW